MNTYFKNNYSVKNFTKPAIYTPDRKKFAGYVKWRQKNAKGTYADYRREKCG